MEFKVEKLEERIGNGHRISTDSNQVQFEQYDCKEGLTLRLQSHGTIGNCRCYSTLFKKFKGTEKDYVLFKDISDALNQYGMQIGTEKEQFMHFIKKGGEYKDLNNNGKMTVQFAKESFPDKLGSYLLKKTTGLYAAIGLATPVIGTLVDPQNSFHVYVFGIGFILATTLGWGVSYFRRKHKELKPGTQLNRFLKHYETVEKKKKKLTNPDKMKKFRAELEQSFEFMIDMWDFTPNQPGMLSIERKFNDRHEAMKFHEYLLETPKLPTHHTNWFKINKPEKPTTDPWEVKIPKVGDEK